MADEKEPIDLDAFLPRVTKLYRPRRMTIPTGSTYTLITAPRPLLMVATSPTTVGTIYVMPRTQPLADDDAIPNTQGFAFLDGVGQFYVRHTSGSAEVFRVFDAGGAGSSSLAAAAAGVVSENINLARIAGTAQTAIDLTGKFSPLTMEALSGVNSDIDAASETVVAARTGRRYLYVENTSTGGQVLWLAFGATAAVVGTGIRLTPGQHFEQTALTGVTEEAVNAIADAANGSASYQEGT